MCEDSRNFRYCNQLNQPTYPKISNQRSQKSILWNFLKFSMNNHPTPGQILGELYGDHMITLAVITWNIFFIRKLFSTSLQIPKQSSSRGILVTNPSFDVILLTASRFYSLDWASSLLKKKKIISNSTNSVHYWSFWTTELSRVCFKDLFRAAVLFMNVCTWFIYEKMLVVMVEHFTTKDPC